MVQVVKRQGYKLINLWTTAKATLPVVFCATFAAVAATGMSLRYLFQNPDVYFRFRVANLKRNPINQSRQFDDLFAKEENQSVKR
ncbi:Histone-lysine N-methyltransferase EZH2 [Phytophthora cinnamomi]|uniref:Histone-lysine N-methyltransferase EZH2 n=1 Tax=Phytophthora cinnamomi TaxID=4785 RepID=UPI00355A16A0|nr:Histone-lysine N-methyltransferase EZH2 [Phytophthora cinnamomi]